MHKVLVALFLVVILFLVNFSIYKKEQILKNGKLFYLKLAPKDPRSLMQGDYMVLRFAIDRDIIGALEREPGLKHTYTILKDTKGFIVVKLNKNKVAHFEKLFKGNNLNENELKLRYKVENHKLKFAPNSFFFQEGNAKKYENAKYGEFRAGEDGDFLLVDLISKELNPVPKVKAKHITKKTTKPKKIATIYRKTNVFKTLLDRKKLIKSQKRLTGKLKKEFEEDSRKTTHPIFVAIKYYQNERFSKLLKGIKNLDIRQRDGMPMIYYAIKYQNLYAVKELLKRGVSLNNRFALKAIHSLAWQGAEDLGIDFLKKLLKLGLDPSHNSPKGMSLVYASAYKCHYKTTKLLLEYGADPYAEFKGENALSIAIKRCKDSPDYQKLLELLSDKRYRK